MLASQVLRSSLRRWYVLVLGLLVTGALTYQVYTTSEPTYEISGTAVLLPGSSTVPEGGNGFLYLGGLNPALEVLMRSANSDATVTEILGDDPGATGYTVERDLDASGPIVLVTATSDSASVARTTLRAVLDVLPERLATLQTDVAVPDAARMSVLDLAVDQEPTALTSDRTRSVLAVVGVGIVATLLLTALVDGLLLSISRRRAARRAKRAEAAPADVPPTTGVPSTTDAAETPPRKKVRATSAGRSSVPTS